MPEQQNIEYKQIWHDDYLKSVCGFANANGGKIFVGKDDEGKVIGLTDSKKLLEDLPNKLRDVLGIMADVNLHEEDGLHFLEIVVPPYTVPISLRGRYYFRSGATKQELIGNALMEFLLRKSGNTWDNVIEPRATLADIDEKSIEKFQKAAEKSGRLPDEDLPIEQFLEKLRLTENGDLKRAAIVLFGKDPGRFYPNQIVKIGRFGTDITDLKFQEVIEGNLFYVLSETAEILNRKFLIKPIEFRGLQRIEKDEYPVSAIREMLLNSLVHRDYMGTTVQIRIYDDKFSIWNQGKLPADVTVEMLKIPHPSYPRNPLIADVCFKGGFIDMWGSGIPKIIRVCRESELPEPLITENMGGFLVEVFKHRFTEEQLRKFDLNERQIKAVLYLVEFGNIDNSTYQELCSVSKSTATRDIKELEEKRILFNRGTKGSSARYELV